jgi:urea ABC transporter ATP-binding protein UrtE
MAEDRKTCLDIKSLSGGYGKVPILHGIEFSVAENEVVGVLGHNGMGKSTLLKTIMGFLPASSGAVRFHGVEINRLSPYERAGLGIGYVPQGRGIFPQLSVRDNLRFAWHDYSGGSEEEVIEAVLADFPRLARLLDRMGGALSGGEQQLLALARSLMGDPEFLLLDEPTEGIQPSIIEEMSETLLHLRERRGLSILLVEQNFDFIADLSDRVLVLERGRIAGELSKVELSDQAKVDQFLGFGAARSTRGNVTATTQAGSAPTTNSPRQQQIADPALITPQPLVTSMTIKRPSLSQMRSMASRFGMNLTDAELAEYSQIMEPYIQAYDRLDALPDNLPEVRYPRSPGRFPDPTENPLNAWYVKTEVRGSSRWAVTRQAHRAQGHYLPCRRADDERFVDHGGLYARNRCHHRHADAGRRRHHRRKGALREFLPVRRVAHQCQGAGTQSVEARLHGQWLVERLSGAGGDRRGRHGDRRRPGRLDQIAVIGLRRLWHEGHSRPRALYGRHAGGDDHRSRRSCHLHCRRQRAIARSAGGRGRA